MNLTPESPELTAYLLDELPPERRAVVDAALAADPALRAELEALRRTAAGLTHALESEPVPQLAGVQRAWVHGGPARRDRDTDGHRAPASRSRPWWQWCIGISTAAGLALIAVSLLLPPPDGASTRAAWLSARLGSRDAQKDGAPVDLDAWRYRANETAVRERALVRASAPAADPAPEAAGEPKQDSLAAVTAVEAESRGADRRKDSAPASVPTSVPTSAAQPRSGGTPVAPVPMFSSAGVAVPATAPTGGVGGARLGEERLQQSVESLDTSLGFRATRGESVVSESLARRAPADVAWSEAKSAATTELVTELAAAPATPPAEGRNERFYWMATDESRPAVRLASQDRGREGYALLPENPFRPVREVPLSTFSIDVDTASYANVRRFLNDGQLPPPGAVRLEEFINYFRYEDPAPTGADPVEPHVEVADCPWASGHRLVRVCLTTRRIPRAERPAANLVFLVDVSGSMQPENKLPLVKQTLRLLTERLTPRDTVAIVTYAGSSRVALEPTGGGERAAILAAIDGLQSGGSTHGSAGITQAYDLAQARYVEGGVNRVLLCTDGDFNVGLTSQAELLDLITAKAKTGVFLSVLGYGVGNYQDRTTELLADKGNGNYAYIDSFREAARVLDGQLEATLVTVAKDVKLQIEFNPGAVASWRLLGYENRVLADRDFNDDTKDAGEVGAGHAVTALYEIVPAGGAGPGVDPLRYASTADVPAADPATAGELLYLKLRFKQPEGSESRLVTRAVPDRNVPAAEASADFRFSAAAAGFGMLLRGSAHAGNLDFDRLLVLAEQGLGSDPAGERAEMIDLIRRARNLKAGGR